MKIGWKSLTGAIIGAVGYLASPGVFALLDEKVAAVVTAAGAVLAVFGIRVALAKR